MALFTIILIITNIALLFPFLILNRRNKTLNNMFNFSLFFVKEELGSIVSLNGPIGIGKTSFQSGMKHISELNIINDLNKLLIDTRMIFKKISFNYIDHILNDYYSSFNLKDKGDYPDFDLITDIIIQTFDINKLNYLNNFLGNTLAHKYILDYSQAYFVLYYRNNYVQSKTPFYSHITGTWNLELDVDWLSIKEAYKNKNYAILDWVVLLIDELTDEAASGMWQQDVRDISGAKEYRRKFRQIHQDRNKLFTTKQDVMDEVKKYRNLTHSHLIIDDRVSTTGNFFIIHSILKGILNIVLFFHKHIYLRLIFYYKKITKNDEAAQINFHNYYEYYSKESNIIRNIGNYLYYVKEFLVSIGYNRYYGRVLSRAEDIEKASVDADQFYLFIPTIFCWGTYDTYLYKSMQRDLTKKSTIITNEIEPKDEDNFFEEFETTNLTDKGDDTFEFS